MRAPVHNLEPISEERLIPVQDRDQDLFLDIAAEEDLGLDLALALKDPTGAQDQGRSLIQLHWSSNL